MLGYQAGLAKPLFLALVPVALLLAGLALWRALSRRSRLTAAIPERLTLVIAPGVSLALPTAQASFYGLGLSLMAFALAQPQCGSHAELTKRRGIDVVVAIDASRSMLARDVVPSRLDRARLELNTLLDELKGDRVAIVGFAGEAFVQCPLTSDYGAAKLFLRAIDPEQVPQGGTNIGAALLLSKQVLTNADHGAKDRVVVLISDGEDLEGDVSAGVDALKELDAKVLAVGIGSEAGEPIPVINKNGEVTGYRKDRDGNTVLTRLDRAGLTRIATDTQGQFFHQPNGVAMGEVVKVIDTLQKSELESRVTVRYAEVFQPYLGAGLGFLVLGMLVLPSFNRRKRA
ncbi:MAG: VWA domain-containing protein [Myxococcaceae bacterium]|nr:VWA domain-containing protein [Myxococcaceae bacterium]